MRLGRFGFFSPLLVVASILIVAGCGSSSENSTASSAPAAAASSTTASASASATATGGRSVEVTTKRNDKLGTILAAGGKDRTVYLFEADKGSSSACSGPCAAAWPPVTGKAMAAGKADAADLGTISRSNGITQVTYKGHPLYYFIKDKDDEDAYGQGVKAFGADWYVLSPNGKKIDES